MKRSYFLSRNPVSVFIVIRVVSERCDKDRVCTEALEPSTGAERRLSLISPICQASRRRATSTQRDSHHRLLPLTLFLIYLLILMSNNIKNYAKRHKKGTNNYSIEVVDAKFAVDLATAQSYSENVFLFIPNLIGERTSSWWNPCQGSDLAFSK